MHHIAPRNLDPALTSGVEQFLGEHLLIVDGPHVELEAAGAQHVHVVEHGDVHPGQRHHVLSSTGDQRGATRGRHAN